MPRGDNTNKHVTLQLKPTHSAEPNLQPLQIHLHTVSYTHLSVVSLHENVVFTAQYLLLTMCVMSV